MNRNTKGARLKALRLEKGMTQEEVGNLISVTKQTLFKYENNIITNIPSNKIQQLAKIYGTTPEYIMGWKEEALPPIPQEQTENLLLTMFADQPDILEFLHEHNFAMQGDISLIGDEETTLVKHAILSSIVKAQRHAKKHHITDNTKSGKATIIIKKEDKKQ